MLRGRGWLVYLGLVYVVVCWGLNVVLVKTALDSGLGPMAFAALRFAAMTPLTFALTRAMGERIRIRRADVPLLLVCGAFGYGIYQYVWMIGLANTTAFASSLLGATSPVFTFAIVALLGHERVRGGRWIGAAIALLGIAVFEGAFAGRATFRIGDVLTLISSIAFAVYNVATARLIGRYPPVTLVAVTMTVGTAMILIGGLPELFHTDLGALGWRVWGPFVYAVIFPIVLTWPVWNYGISRIGAARVAIFGFLVPIVAGVASIPILHERYAVHQLVGAAICIVGMIMASLLGRFSAPATWSERTLPFER